MKLTNRQNKVLQLLKRSRDFLTIQTISDEVGFSKRTIYSELYILDRYLNHSGQKIERKRGVGVRLVSVSEAANKSEEYELINDSTINSRRISIMRKLLFNNDVLTYQELSDEFFVSNASIKTDLRFINDLLSRNNESIIVSNHKGTRLVRNEKIIRNGFFEFNIFLLKSNSLNSTQYSDEKLDLLKSYYGEEIIEASKSLLYTHVKDNTDMIADHYLFSILNIMIVIFYRLKFENYLPEESNSEQSEVLENAEDILKKASFKIGFNYFAADINFFVDYLLSYKFGKIDEDSIKEKEVTKFIDDISRLMELPFREDKILTKQLLNHMPAMLLRLQNNLRIENPFLNQIKVEFPLTFNTLYLVLGSLEKDYDIKVTDDEVGFLTLYFQASLERNKLNNKILVVCQTGVATSELLLNRLKNSFSTLDSISVSSLGELEAIDLTKFDLVLSTIDISIDHPNYFFVSPFISFSELEKIKPVLDRPKNKTEIIRLNELKVLKNFLLEQFIILDAEYRNKNDLITSVCRKLENEGYVTKKFEQNIFERETIGSTDMPSGAAVPHGKMEEVKHSVVVIIKNKRKIKWNEYFVDVAFFICISNEDKHLISGLFKEVYWLVESRENLMELFKFKDSVALFDEIGDE